jgi:hypothetical protein
LAHVHLSLLVVVAGCAHPARVTECDELVGLVGKLSTCPKLPSRAREKLGEIQRQVGALVDGNGPRAELGKVCRTQRDALAQVYAPLAPDCVR